MRLRLLELDIVGAPAGIQGEQGVNDEVAVAEAGAHFS